MSISKCTKKDKILLGDGASGKVYLITIVNKIQNKKFIRKEFNNKESFINESKLLINLYNIEGIPKIININYEKLYIDTVYNDAKDLYNILFQKDDKDESVELNEIEIIIIIDKCINILKQVHELGYVHRDIKLENILYNRKTLEVTIIDWEFGLNINSMSEYSCLYNYGTDINNPPEYYYKRYIDYRNIDIWQFGIVIYELMTKRHIYNHIYNLNNYELKRHICSMSWNKKYLIGNNNLIHLFNSIFIYENSRCNITELNKLFNNSKDEILNIKSYIKNKEYKKYKSYKICTIL
jgi:serine/threonine protein kinase